MKKQFMVSIASIFLGLLAGAILMLALGHNPAEGYLYLFQGGIDGLERIGNTIATATPLILTGLSLAFAYKTGLFNIGAPGQMLIGGLCATAIGLSFDLPRIILLPTIIVGGILGGALWASIPGFLKAKFNVHEVVSSIMMNWIAYWGVYYTIPAYFKGEFLETESAKLPEAATLRFEGLTDLFQGSYINLGIILAIFSVFVIWFVLEKTTLGYELKAVGYNKHAAEYAGIAVNKKMVLSMMIAGGLAGLAGVIFYTGNATCMQIGVMPSQGFDGIAVALLAGNSPIGVIFSALFFGLLYAGRGFMTAMASTGIPPEIADTILSIIIYFSATSAIIKIALDKFLKKKKEKAEGKEV